jgi:methyl-accepting chemotaxis protein
MASMTDIVAEIVATAQEQVAGLDQINRAVAQIGQVTQQNAASSEESSSAAAELAGQSDDLAGLVATFQVGDSAISAAPLPGDVAPGCLVPDRPRPIARA